MQLTTWRLGDGLERRSTQWKHPRPEIEAMYSEWMQENGDNFSRSMSSSAASQRRA